MTKDRTLRDHLLYLLRGGGAHLRCEDLVADYPVELINRKIEGVPYTPWQVLEHMRTRFHRPDLAAKNTRAWLPKRRSAAGQSNGLIRSKRGSISC